MTPEAIKKAVEKYRSHYRIPCPEFTRDMLKRIGPGKWRSKKICDLIDQAVDDYYHLGYEQPDLFKGE